MSPNTFDRIEEYVNSEEIRTDPDRGEIPKILLKAIQTTREMVVVTNAPEQFGQEEIVFVNKAFESVTQYSKQEVLGRSPSLLQGPDTDPEVIDRLVKNLEKGEHFEGETFNYKKDGTRYRVRWSIDPIRNREGTITHFVSVQRDITEEWEKQQQLERMIEERETLVKESHHRIKNNLATITGLLELQVHKTDSDEIRTALTESMNRVRSIASIHEKLYNTEGLTDISLDDYIRDLIDHFKNSMDGISENNEIEFELELQSISLGTRQAVPLGLILNELITNARKHAFDEEGGSISVACSEEKGRIMLEVEDDGKGIPDDFDLHAADSLGLKLIDTLSHQLEAEYDFHTDKGTHFRMSFSREE